MKRWIVALTLGLFGSPAIAAGALAQMEIVDSASGQVLPVYRSEGRFFVAGSPGREYVIRLRNRSHGDLLAVVSVDGINVVTGETAAVDQGGYILGRRQRLDIEGWRKSLEQVATFYFSRVDASYAAQTGRPDNVGVIGVALFRRKAEPRLFEDDQRKRVPGAASEPVAPGGLDSNERAADAAGLGTGHGRRRDSQVRYGQFERASPRPDDVISIYYDSRANLIARGVIPGARPVPRPFPDGFVPDPPSG
jgi:hypothetical protein